MQKLSILILLFFSIFSFGQTQNISELSTGVLERSSTLNDKNRNVIGYTYLFNKGLTKDTNEQEYEYIILDNNLNKLTNGDFKMQHHAKLLYKISNISFDNQKLYVTISLFNKATFLNIGDILTIINLKNNEIESNILAVNGDIIKSYNLEEHYKNKFSRNSTSTFPYFKGSQVYYIEPQYEILNRGSSLNFINFYTADFNKIFDVNISKEDKKAGVSYEINTLNDDKIVLFNQKINKGNVYKIGLDYLITYNLNDGTIPSKIVYNSKNTQGNEYFLPNSEIIGNNLLVVGEIKKADNQIVASVENGPSLGLKRNIYDDKGEIVQEQVTYYNDIFKDLGFKDGRDNKGYKYLLTEFFNYNDNSFTVLLEKQKGDGYITATKTTDYIIVNFDKNGVFKDYQLIEKSKNYYENYMFSQENRDENEVLFFYQETVKGKVSGLTRKFNYNLVINKLKNGVLTQERMPFETESSNLRFSRAKYGYILITEYNKDDKESSIRIEKLNI